MILFEKDIYPAFTSGDNAKIIQSLDQMIGEASKSTQDADAVFRLINWSWPVLTTRARTSSDDGVKIVDRFTVLITTLMTTMSPNLLSQLGDCKSVLRAIIRGLNVIYSEVALRYLKGIEEHIVPLKTVRGFFLDRVAMDHLIAFSATADEVGEASIRLLIEALKSRRLHSPEQIVEFLARIAKLNGCNAVSASLCRQVLSSHNSGPLYDSLMEKLTFVNLSGDSTLRRLTAVTFLIHLTSSRCPGERLPVSLSKSEFTTPILNWKQNRLVAIFTLRLVRSLLQRLDPRRERALMGLVRDRLVELNSIVPVVKQVMSESKSEAEQFLLISELTSLVLEYKRALPGSFVDCKFDWTKIIEEFPSAPSVVRKTLVRFVFSVHRSTVPVSQNLARLFARISKSGEDETVFACFEEWLSGPMLGLDLGSAACIVAALRKRGMETAVKFLTFVVGQFVNNPENLGKCSLIELVEQSEDFSDLASSIGKRIAKRKRKSLEASGEEPQLPTSIPTKTQSQSVDMENAGKTTKVWAKAITKSSSVDLIDVAGTEKLYSAVLSLASADDSVRKSAFEVLAVILRALAVSIEAKGVETSRFVFREAPQVAMILTWLRNGIPTLEDAGKSCPEPIPLISAVFIVEALRILFDPKNILYTSVYKFILARFAMNVHGDVPMWNELFLSEDGAHIRAHRAWILEILARAACDRKSVEIMIRRGVVETLLDSAVNLVSTGEEVDAILNIVNTALKTANEEVELVNRFALCQWIQNVSNSRHVKFLDA